MLNKREITKIRTCVLGRNDCKKLEYVCMQYSRQLYKIQKNILSNADEFKYKYNNIVLYKMQCDNKKLNRKVAKISIIEINK